MLIIATMLIFNELRGHTRAKKLSDRLILKTLFRKLVPVLLAREDSN